VDNSRTPADKSPGLLVQPVTRLGQTGWIWPRPVHTAGLDPVHKKKREKEKFFHWARSESQAQPAQITFAKGVLGKTLSCALPMYFIIFLS